MPKAALGTVETSRQRIRVNGVVQGVGFRPFVYRLAQERALAGFVQNDGDGVVIEVQGAAKKLADFPAAIQQEAPDAAHITDLAVEQISPRRENGFSIIASTQNGAPSTLISPDLNVCDDCLRELFDPKDRRYRYPFINCTNCGPRFTIISGVPYDRPFTSMAVFEQCEACLREYHDPENRRFHAQPNACADCGPSLNFYNPDDNGPKTNDAIAATIEWLKAGRIVAIRGLGGFHLACDAFNAKAVQRLRERKGRAEKPFALMAPDVETVARFCEINAAERSALESVARPIVILRAKMKNELPRNSAPGNRNLGFMLPATPLHHLLLRDNFPALVMTSANFSEEPIAISNDEALERLAGIADGFLLHNREILQRCDDSIVRFCLNETRVLRRARGFVPAPVQLGDKMNGEVRRRTKPTPGLSREKAGAFKGRFSENLSIIRHVIPAQAGIQTTAPQSWVPACAGMTEAVLSSKREKPTPKRGPGVGKLRRPHANTLNQKTSTSTFHHPILACGGELKNAIALSRSDQAFLSQHIGDLDNPKAMQFFEECVTHLQKILQVQPEWIAHDLHPEYLSTKWALRQSAPKIGVQHHHAHLAAVMAENGVTEPTIGVILDGTGYGTDGTIWGGEILVGDCADFERTAWLEPAPMPGGDAAIRQPWRMALSYLQAAFGQEAEQFIPGSLKSIPDERRRVVLKMIRQGLNAPLTSSCGRLFDAVAALLGLGAEISFEAQAAIALEMCADEKEKSIYAEAVESAKAEFGAITTAPLIRCIVDDIQKDVPSKKIAARFHRTLAEIFVQQTMLAAESTGLHRVGLSGGVFQNAFFFSVIIERLRAAGFEVLTHKTIPCNDGGLALGQIAVAKARINRT